MRKTKAFRKKFDRCVSKVSKSSPDYNPFAVCMSSLKKTMGAFDLFDEDVTCPVGTSYNFISDKCEDVVALPKIEDVKDVQVFVEEKSDAKVLSSRTPDEVKGLSYFDKLSNTVKAYPIAFIGPVAVLIGSYYLLKRTK